MLPVLVRVPNPIGKPGPGPEPLGYAWSYALVVYRSSFGGGLGNGS